MIKLFKNKKINEKGFTPTVDFDDVSTSLKHSSRASSKFTAGFTPIVDFDDVSTSLKHSSRASSKFTAGFTLVEALTAIFILTFVVVGLMTVVSNSLFVSRYARNEITANYLLQEVIDYVRNDRDTSVFLTTSVGGIDVAWSNFYAKYISCQSTNGCSIDVKTGISSVASCPVSGCPYLYLNDNDSSDNALYLTDNGSGMTGMRKTDYQRKIVFSQPESSQIKVEVTVSWKNGNLSKSRSLQTTLTKW